MAYILSEVIIYSFCVQFSAKICMLSENFEKINVSYPVHLLLCKNGIERTRIPENFGTGTEMEPKRNQNRNRKNPSLDGVTNDGDGVGGRV